MLRLGLAGSAAALREHLMAGPTRAQAPRGAPPADPRERHLAGLRQLTFGGQNAEAYWDRTGTRLVFQSTRPPFGCDQIFTMRADGSDVRLVSTGRGRTTCAFFSPDGARILYASTHLGRSECPPPPDRSRGYVWALYDYDLLISAHDGSTEQWLTSHPGYDGGPFFSWDGRQIVWRGWHPSDPDELAAYRAFLAKGLVRPNQAELFVMDADGTAARQVTANGAANWAPSLHPDGERIAFSSNLHDPGRFDFALYLVRRDGRGLERLTYGESFTSFPMFSPDGRRLVFCSSRGATAPREFNVFVADWVE